MQTVRHVGREGDKVYTYTYMYLYITTVCTVISTCLLHTNIFGFRVPHDLCRVVGSAIMQSDQLTRYWIEIYNHVAMLQCMVLPLHSSYTIGTQCFVGGDSKDQSIQKPHQRKSSTKGEAAPLYPPWGKTMGTYTCTSHVLTVISNQ